MIQIPYINNSSLHETFTIYSSNVTFIHRWLEQIPSEGGCSFYINLNCWSFTRPFYFWCMSWCLWLSTMPPGHVWVHVLYLNAHIPMQVCDLWCIVVHVTPPFLLPRGKFFTGHKMYYLSLVLKIIHNFTIHNT